MRRFAKGTSVPVERPRAEIERVVVPGSNDTVGQWAAPQIAAAYQRGTSIPPLLSAGPS